MIINYEEIEKPIKEIEKILEAFDTEEKSLILKFINQRHQQKIQKTKMFETINDDPIVGFARKFIDKNLKPKEE